MVYRVLNTNKSQTKISLLADHKSYAPIVAGWYFSEWPSDDPETTIESITEKILSGANRSKIPLLFLSHTGDEVVGAGEIKHRQLQAYPDYNYWLDGIYVKPSYRGKGISTQLIEFAKRKAVELGIFSLYLRCNEHNVKLYEARGFNVLKPEGEKLIMGLEFNKL